MAISELSDTSLGGDRILRAWPEWRGVNLLPWLRSGLQRRNVTAYAVFASIIIILTALRLVDLPLIVQAKLAVFDSYQRWSPRPYQPSPIKVIDIDDASLRKLGQWPWPRWKLAELVDHLSSLGAAAIVFDIVFAEPDRMSPATIADLWPSNDRSKIVTQLLNEWPDPDADFAAAIARSPVVLGFGLIDGPMARPPDIKAGLAAIGPDPAGFLSDFRGAVTNLPSLETAAKGLGSFSVTSKVDDVIRRVPLLQTLNGAVIPSLAIEALRVAQGTRTLRVKSLNAEQAARMARRPGLQKIRVGAIDIPVDPDGQVWIHYTEPAPERTLPAWKIFDDDARSGEIKNQIAGQILLLGTSAVGLKDLRATPLNPFEAGVAVHAQLLEQLLVGSFLQRPSWIVGAEVLGVIVLGAAVVQLLLVAGPFASAMVAAAFALMVMGASWTAFTTFYLLVDPTYPLFALLVIYSAIMLVTHIFAERERKTVKTAFTHYLAPTVVRQLMERPDQLRLGGDTREMTFLFTDIAGFTTFSERTDPETLVRLLNSYLDRLCGLVMDQGGTIDKIVGDAVHAMFNAPLSQADHAERAVRCALLIDQFSQQFVAEQRDQGVMFGETRIGVNTGVAVVGNFGGQRRFDYTAHGDAINTAARLESVNKHLGTRVCVAGTTASQCQDQLFRPVGALVLKGKEIAIDTFEPVKGNEQNYAPLAAYKEAFDQLSDAHDKAIQQFTSLASCYDEDPLVRLHHGRLTAGEQGSTIILAEK